MEYLDDNEFCVLTHLGTLRVFGRVKIEPAIEFLRVGEDVRHQEVEQRPQLLDVVLQRCSSEEYAPASLDLSRQLYRDRL